MVRLTRQVVLGRVTSLASGGETQNCTPRFADAIAQHAPEVLTSLRTSVLPIWTAAISSVPRPSNYDVPSGFRLQWAAELGHAPSADALAVLALWEFSERLGLVFLTNTVMPTLVWWSEPGVSPTTWLTLMNRVEYHRIEETDASLPRPWTTSGEQALSDARRGRRRAPRGYKERIVKLWRRLTSNEESARPLSYEKFGPPDQHFEWLVRVHVKREKAAHLAALAHVSDAAVEVAVHRLRKALGLRPP